MSNRPWPSGSIWIGIGMIYGCNGTFAQQPPSSDAVSVPRVVVSNDVCDACVSIQDRMSGSGRPKLLSVSITPESRVKGTLGLERPTLVQGEWCEFQIAIENGSGIQSDLVIESNQTIDAKHPQSRWRWLKVELVPNGPLTGESQEVRTIRLWTDAKGKRAAVLNVNAGQGTQDLGFRSDVLVVFDIQAHLRRGSEPNDQADTKIAHPGVR